MPVAIHIDETAVLTHKAGFCCGKGIISLSAEAEAGHDAGHGAVEQVEQVGGVAAHQGPGQTQYFFRFVAEHGHGLALRRTRVFVLVGLVDNRQAKRLAREISFDIFRGLVTDHAQSKFQPSQSLFQRCGVFILEDKLALTVAEIDEIIDVVIHDARQHFNSEHRYQPVGRYLADTWQQVQELAQLALRRFVSGFFVTHGPQGLLAMAAAFAPLTPPAIIGRQWRAIAVELELATVWTGDRRIADDDVLAVFIVFDIAIVTLPIGGFPVKAHTHPHPAKDEVMQLAVIVATGLQIAAEADQVVNGMTAIDGMHDSIGDGIQNLAPPLVHQMRRTDDQHGLRRIPLREQRRDTDAHQRFSRPHFPVKENGRQTVIHQTGIAGKDALLLRGKRLAFQVLQQRVLPGFVLTVVDDRRLLVNLGQQWLAEVSKEAGKRNAVFCAGIIRG